MGYKVAQESHGMQQSGILGNQDDNWAIIEEAHTWIEFGCCSSCLFAN
jgi:hypothetical protein